MKAYWFSKKIAKISIAVAFLAISAAAGSFLYQSQYSADSNTGTCGSSENSGMAQINLEDPSDGNGSVTFSYPSDLRSRDIVYTITAQYGYNGSKYNSKTISSGTIPANEQNKTVKFSLESSSISDTYTITVTANEKGCSKKSTLDTKAIHVYNCSLFPRPNITIPALSVLKPNQEFTIHIQDSENFGNQRAAVYINVSDKKGTLWPRYTGDVIYGTNQWDFNVSAEEPGWHTVKVEVKGEDICPIGSSQATFCISEDGKTCDGTPPATTTTTEDDNAGNGSNTASSSVSGKEIHASKITTLRGLVNKVIPLLSVAIGVLFFAGCVVGGYTYITAGPNEAQAEKGKKALLYSIIGVAIAALSYWIVTAVMGTLSTVK